YIKSKMLLPVYEDEQPEDPRTELVEALLEYQRIKEASSVLDRMSDIGKDIFVKPQEILERDTSKIDYSYSADDLIKIFNNIFERSARRLPPPITAFSGIVGRESVPVELKIKQIGDMLIRDRQLDFDALVLASQNRSEMIAVFLAVLELSKAHQLTIEELGGKYMLKLSEGSNGAD
ncbi:MAG: segregation/condensation protein A, partial [Clostridia bacterium]|nr:segregation/condensation protein A [Clostridia bacterium]